MKISSEVPRRPDLDTIIEAVSAYRDAGVTGVALVPVGGDSQDGVPAEATKPLLAALRSENE